MYDRIACCASCVCVRMCVVMRFFLFIRAARPIRTRRLHYVCSKGNEIQTLLTAPIYTDWTVFSQILIRKFTVCFLPITPLPIGQFCHTFQLGNSLFHAFSSASRTVSLSRNCLVWAAAHSSAHPVGHELHCHHRPPATTIGSDALFRHFRLPRCTHTHTHISTVCTPSRGKWSFIAVWHKRAYIISYHFSA